MKYWPVPDSYSKKIPKNNKPGSFWEDRGDRFHCGVDIYAPRLSKVLSIENGKVIDSGIFTSPNELYYWNSTYYIDIKIHEGFYCRYAELDNLVVNNGDIVKAGELIGYVGQVLNKFKINFNAPKYIQELKSKSHSSMLHFEIYKQRSQKSKKYFGGNWFGKNKPKDLLDPTKLFTSV